MNLPKEDEININVEPSSPPVEIECNQLNLDDIKIGDFVIFITNLSDSISIQYINHLLSRYQFHYTDIYTINPLKYKNQFLYPCRFLSADQINQHLTDVYARQFGPVVPAKLKQSNSNGNITHITNFNNNTLDPPIFHLPHNTFVNILEETYIKINQYLMVPFACLVLFHLGFPTRSHFGSHSSGLSSFHLTLSPAKIKSADGNNTDNDTNCHFEKWYKSILVNNLLTLLTSSNNLFRILCGKYEEKIPTAWIEKADYLFLFKPQSNNEKEYLLQIYHLYLTSVFHSLQVLCEFIETFVENKALIILPWWKVFTLAELQQLRPLSPTFPIRSERIRWFEFKINSQYITE